MDIAKSLRKSARYIGRAAGKGGNSLGFGAVTASAGAIVGAAASLAIGGDPDFANFVTESINSGQAQAVMAGSIGLGFAVDVAFKNPLKRLKALSSNRPEDVMNRLDKIAEKNPEKAGAYINERLEGMSLKERVAFHSAMEEEQGSPGPKSAGVKAYEAAISEGFEKNEKIEKQREFATNFNF